MNFIKNTFLFLFICLFGLTVYLAIVHKPVFTPHDGLITHSPGFIAFLVLWFVSLLLHLFALYKSFYKDNINLIYGFAFFVLFYVLIWAAFTDFFRVTLLFTAIVPIYFGVVFAMPLIQYFKQGKKTNPEFSKLQINKYILWGVLVFNILMGAWFVKAFAWNYYFQTTNKEEIIKKLQNIKDAEEQLKAASQRLKKSDKKHKKTHTKTWETDKNTNKKTPAMIKEEAKKKLEAALKRKKERQEKNRKKQEEEETSTND